MASKNLKIYDIDPLLKDYKSDLDLRMKLYNQKKKELVGSKGSLVDYANGHHYYGFHKDRRGWYYREWAPGADALYLVGDFNGWDRRSHPLAKIDDESWEIYIPKITTIPHGSRLKVVVVSSMGEHDRIPLYATRVDRNDDGDFAAILQNPRRKFTWTDEKFKLNKNFQPFIYEAHIGMAQDEEKVSTYKEFEDNILPRIKDLNYNTIQLMAIMQHPYYGSFGYQVSNFFAASSWFGDNEDLKSLVNKAHEMGIAVIMDIVHSHAVTNTDEGINCFDGTVYQFFHDGAMGDHPAWGSKCFDYGKNGVIHYLLSNVKFWMEEYHFDGFRFDGVTSMLYHDHGLGTDFNTYKKYFSLNTDVNAVTYLQLANTLIKEIKKNSISISEDMSGMPGMCLPVSYGGIGFDYRLAMGIPDFWVKTLKTNAESWNMYSLWYELSTTRPEEKRIAYAESHDQALVGDKTIIFRLADKDMYWHMDKASENISIDFAISMHKMIRLVTMSMGADGYLNFLGNEFGHPEWIDFPREGNGWSFKYCKRQWNLVDNPFLRYEYLNNWDRTIVGFMKDHGLMGEYNPTPLLIDDERKIIAYRKNDYIFIYNFHPTNSYEHFELATNDDKKYGVILDSDEPNYGGFSRISKEYIYQSQPLANNNKHNGITLYLPATTVMVLEPK